MGSKSVSYEAIDTKQALWGPNLMGSKSGSCEAIGTKQARWGPNANIVTTVRVIDSLGVAGGRASKRAGE